MKTKLFSLLIILGIAFGNFSCASVSEAKKVADQLFEALKAKNYDAVLAMLDEEALDATPKEGWLELFARIDNIAGGLKEWSNYAFNTKTDNGVTITGLKYELTFENKTLYAKPTFVKRGNEYKLPKVSHVSNP